MYWFFLLQGPKVQISAESYWKHVLVSVQDEFLPSLPKMDCRSQKLDSMVSEKIRMHNKQSLFRKRKKWSSLWVQIAIIPSFWKNEVFLYTPYLRPVGTVCFAGLVTAQKCQESKPSQQMVTLWFLGHISLGHILLFINIPKTNLAPICSFSLKATGSSGLLNLLLEEEMVEGHTVLARKGRYPFLVAALLQRIHFARKDRLINIALSAAHLP